MDRRDDILSAQLEALRIMNEHNLRRVGSDFFGSTPAAPKQPTPQADKPTDRRTTLSAQEPIEEPAAPEKESIEDLKAELNGYVGLAAIKEEVAADEPSVIISRRPCALLKHVKHPGPISAKADACRGCKACMKIGCPAISMRDGKAVIDETLCTGCGVCRQMCKFGAL